MNTERIILVAAIIISVGLAYMTGYLEGRRDAMINHYCFILDKERK